MRQEPEFWHPKEAAEYLRIHVGTLYEWVSNTKKSNRNQPVLLGPKPPFHRFGRKVIRFPVKAFRDWANKFHVDNQKGK